MKVYNILNRRDVPLPIAAGFFEDAGSRARGEELTRDPRLFPRHGLRSPPMDSVSLLADYDYGSNDIAMISFGDQIRRARKAKGLTLEKLGSKVGIGKSYLSGIERGKVAPPFPKRIEGLALALDLGVNSMLILAWAEKAPMGIRARLLKLIAKEVES